MVSQVSGVHRLSQSVGEETAQGCAGDKSSPPDTTIIPFSQGFCQGKTFDFYRFWQVFVGISLLQLSLKVANHQKEFVDSNVQSLAHASVSPTYHTFGIYDADAHYRANPSMVGFVMYEFIDAVGFVLRLMIDEKFQRRGYGRVAMIEVIRRLKLHPEIERIATSHAKKNEAAARLYEGLGFVDWKHESRTDDSGLRYLILQE